MNELIEVLTPAIILAITAMSGYVGQKVALYYKAKTSTEQQDQVMKVIKASVQYVEMITEEGIVSGKFEQAKLRAKNILNGMGLQVTDEEVQTWIESFVLELKIQEKVGE